MAEKGRKVEIQGEGVTPKELEPLLWQAHVNEEMDRLAREHKPAPAVSHFAEEYAERAISAVEAGENEYQRAAERGERLGKGEVAGHLAGAGDIAGG